MPLEAVVEEILEEDRLVEQDINSELEEQHGEEENLDVMADELGAMVEMMAMVEQEMGAVEMELNGELLDVLEEEEEEELGAADAA